MRLAGFLVAMIFSAACQGGAIDACDVDPDLSGPWQLSLAPLPADAGVATIPSALTIDAELEQGTSTDFLGLGRHVYGSLTASDPRYFGMIAIPHLLNNDGGKSGAILQCNLNINVPVATPVTDDDTDQGPLRIALVGKVVMFGQMLGGDGSRLIMQSDTTLTPRAFSWTGTRK